MRIRRGVLLVLLVALVAIASMLLLDSHHRSELRRSWEERHGPAFWVTGREAAGANATAIRVEELAARLGVSIVPTGADRPRPDRSRLTEYRTTLHDTKPVFWSLVRATSGTPATPHPARFLEFFQRHREDLDALHAALLEDPPPRWEYWPSRDRQPDELPVLLPPAGWYIGSPARQSIVNAQGHMMLQRMMLLDGLAREDPAVTLRALEASWRLNGALAEAPTVKVQALRCRIASYQAGILRRLQDVPDVWIERMDLRPCRAMWLRVVGGLGWSILSESGSSIDWPTGREMAHSMTALDNLVPRLEAHPPCAVPRGLDPSFPLLSGYWYALHRLAIDLSVTRAVLEARRHRRRHGAWPRELAGLDAAPCELSWQVVGDAASLRVVADLPSSLPAEWCHPPCRTN